MSLKLRPENFTESLETVMFIIDKEDFVHKGIAKRSFKRQLQLAEYVECNGAKLEDGMLKDFYKDSKKVNNQKV